MSPLLIGFFRVAFAAPALVVAARILVRPRPHPAPGDRLRLLAGGLAMGAYQACYFWAVAKAGTIVRASEQLHLAHPTISAQVHRLEDSLGEKLFSRRGRQLRLAP